MTARSVLDYFLEIFPEENFQIKSYKAIGKDAIEIRLVNGSVLYFAKRPTRKRGVIPWVLSTQEEDVCSK